MCVWTAQAWSNCMYSLLEKRSKKDLNSVIFLTFWETLWKDGRSGLQGVPKGCQRSGPVDPNVGPAMPKRCPKVSKGAHLVPKGCSKGGQGCPRVPTWCAKGAQRVAKGAPAVPLGAQRVPKVCPRGNWAASVYQGGLLKNTL